MSRGGLHRDTLWHSIVHQYTRQRLTFEKDIFPALQGVAKAFNCERKSVYLTGLWESNILTDLLWYCSAYKRENARPQRWRAPSWSWASIVNPVEWVHRLGNDFHILAKYVSSNITLAAEDAFGEISAGSITLEGRCTLARREKNSLLLHSSLSKISALGQVALWIGRAGKSL
jgi:hypothetical protein